MLNTESSIKYFTTQTIASSVLLIAIILLSNNIYLRLSNLILNSAILIKLGSAPFHFWFPEVIEGQKWSTCLIILTLQKIIPFIIITYSNFLFFSRIIILNIIIRIIIGLNQTSLRKIITFSSINHIAWIIRVIIFSKIIWTIYFIIYIITIIIIIRLFNKLNIYNFSQLIKINLPLNFKLILIIIFFSIAGLPPFIGFIPKWLTINLLIINNLYFLTTIIVILTLFTIFYYLRLILITLIFSTFKINNNINFKINLNLLMLINLPILIIFYI